MSDPYKRLRAALSARHTPGWWKVFHRGTTRALMGDDGQEIIHWLGFDNSSLPKGEQTANLRYFAAAQPEVIRKLLRERDDLLAEIKRLREGGNPTETRGDLSRAFDIIAGAWSRARAAGIEPDDGSLWPHIKQELVERSNAADAALKFNGEGQQP